MSEPQQHPDARQDTHHDDEIDLIDILAVLVRHRRLIVLGTAAVLVAVVLYTVALPAAGIRETPDNLYTVEHEVRIARLDPSVENALSPNPEGRVRTRLGEARAIARAYEAVDPEAAQTRTPEEYNRWIRSTIIGERLSVNYSEDRSAITVSYEDRDRGRALSFIEELEGVIDESLEPVFDTDIPRAVERERNSLEQVASLIRSAVQRSAGTDGEDMNALLVRLEQEAGEQLSLFVDRQWVISRLEQLADTPGELYSHDEEPFVMSEPAGGNPQALIVVATVAALFLFIFLAFVMEMVRNVRRDEAQLANLRAAWRRE